MPKRRRQPTARISRAVALSLALTALVLAQLACGGAGLTGGARDRVEGDWARVYFTAPAFSAQDGYPRRDLAADFVWLIEQAEASVDLAAYDLDLPPVADALLAAHRRGVDVRVVTESDNAHREALRTLQAAGVPVVEDQPDDGLMHNKFAVIDDQWVWTGSWNMTENGTYRNDNHAVLIASLALAENYRAEFDEMFAGQFGPTSPLNTPHPHVVITVDADQGRTRRVELEAYFAPEGDVVDEVVAHIQGARERVRFMAFVFTSDEIADAMVERAEAGVVVQGVVEARNTEAPYSQVPRLRAAVHDVLLDGNPYIMHHKVIIIDDQTVILGSYNFSHSAETRNDENVLVVHDAEVARLFVEEFGRVYDEARQAE